MKIAFGHPFFCKILHPLNKPRESANLNFDMPSKKDWVWAPAKPAKLKVPESTKIAVQSRADEWVASFVRPEFVKSEPDDARFAFVTDISAGWRGSFFTFKATFSRVSEETGVAAPAFETPFARLEYTGPNSYGLAYFRHTGKFWEIYSELSLDEAFENLRTQNHFWPL